MTSLADQMKEDILFEGDTCVVDVWYPRSPGAIKYVQVGLVDVRAADSIRINYDFMRDGWVIEQASISKWAPDDEVCDPGWKETAFLPAWALAPSGDR